MRYLDVRGVTLCADTHGDPDDPALLLIGGACSAMDYWHPEFCDRLAAGGLFVIRYDHRDTGQSTTYARGEPEYTDMDLALDAIGVLHALGMRRTHLAGISMGGGIAQTLTARYPDRIDSLTLMSTSPELDRPADAPALPPIGHGMSSDDPPPPDPDWSDSVAVTEHLRSILIGERGSEGIADEDARELAEQLVARSVDPAAVNNHWIALGAGSDDPEPPAALNSLAEIPVPTLVVHGDEDPLFSLPHAEALATEIPRASLLVLPGVAHEYPPRAYWPEVTDAMLAMTTGR